MVLFFIPNLCNVAWTAIVSSKNAADLGDHAASSGATTTSNQQQQPPVSQDLAATLRALADKQPQFANDQTNAPQLGGEEEALLTRLAEQLQGFADDPSVLGGGEGVSGGDNASAGGGMSSLVDTIMAQLLSKDVLYQPMKVQALTVCFFALFHPINRELNREHLIPYLFMSFIDY